MKKGTPFFCFVLNRSKVSARVIATAAVYRVICTTGGQKKACACTFKKRKKKPSHLKHKVPNGVGAQGWQRLHQTKHPADKGGSDKSSARKW